MNELIPRNDKGQFVKGFIPPTCFKKGTISLNIEHKIPLSRGGNNLYENLAISCRSCNSSKRNKTEEEFGKELIRE